MSETQEKPTIACTRLFPLGQTIITSDALSAIEAMHGTYAAMTISGLLWRHQHGDWGDLDAEDCTANRQAIKDEARILSAYNVPVQPILTHCQPGTAVTEARTMRVLVISEWDRSHTTIMLSDEY